MTHERPDTDLESIRELWHVPVPDPAMHERVIRACNLELSKRTRIRRLSWTLGTAAAFLLVASIVVHSDLRRSMQHPRSSAAGRVTRFYPLVDVPPSFGNGLLVRVTVPESMLAISGIPVPPQHLDTDIQADLLIGEDGSARAIRFVESDQEY